MHHAEVTESIIGAAMTVLNELKPGLDEKIYERALVIELTSQGHMLLNFKEARLHWKRVVGARRDLTTDDSDSTDGKQDCKAPAV